MHTYIVATSALEGARYIRSVGFDARRTRTILWPAELAALDPEGTRVVFLRGWSETRSRAAVERIRACAQALAARGAVVTRDDLDDATAFRMASRRRAA